VQALLADRRGREMTPADLMNSCCDPHAVPAFKNDFWVITQEELERFYRAAFNAGIEAAAKHVESDTHNYALCIRTLEKK
jgi:hypothetical protein